MPSRPAPRSARGQSTALIVTMLWVFVLFVGMVGVVGQAVNRRIALQIVADSGAWTAATVMATGMNHLAYWNRQIQRAWGRLTLGTAGFFVPFSLSECISGWAMVGDYYAVQAAFADAYGQFTYQVNFWPRNTSDFNARELFPGETLSYAQTDGSIGLIQGTVPPWILIGPVENGSEPDVGGHPWAVETPWDLFPPLRYPIKSMTGLRNRFGTLSWTCYTPPVTVSTVTMYVLPWWKLQRIGGREYYFSWRVEAPAKKAMMFDWFFGPNTIPAMKAVAVAKPVGGNIQKGESEYVAKMLPAKRGMPAGFIHDPYYMRFGGFRQVVH